MRNLMAKELKLSLHATTWIFLGLTCMLIIPSYPYFVVFFYMCLGIFFICLQGRENNDIAFTMSLPVKKRDVVRARILLACLIQLTQVVCCIPFLFLAKLSNPGGNAVGMDPNAAFLGLGLLFFGLFNLFFFPRYYANVVKVGGAFFAGVTASFVFMLAVETCVHAVPFVKTAVDGYDPACRGVRVIILALGALLYAAMTFLACRMSEKRFEKLDL